MCGIFRIRAHRVRHVSFITRVSSRELPLQRTSTGTALTSPASSPETLPHPPAPATRGAFYGIAPHANLINLRVLDGNGVGTDSAVVAAIDRAIKLKNQYNIRVINLSLGRPVFESYTLDPLCQAVERAWQAGIVVVVAAGNEGRNRSQGTDGYATITAPANDPLVITVGAMKHMSSNSRSDDLIASYSSKGPTLIDHVVKPDIVAPGNRLISLQASKSLTSSKSSTNRILYSYYQKTTSKSYSADYYRLSGTSMAAPVISGAAALMLHSDWTLQQRDHQGPADENRDESVSYVQHSYGSGDQHSVHHSVRHVYHRRGIRRRVGGPE